VVVSARLPSKACTVSGNPAPSVSRPTVTRGSRTDFFQHAQRVELAGRLHDPGEHQRLEHLVPPGRGAEPQRLVAPGQRVEQVSRP
jgi:hypothetical protein